MIPTSSMLRPLQPDLQAGGGSQNWRFGLALRILERPYDQDEVGFVGLVGVSDDAVR